jgi:hypothetical protein
VVGIVIAHWFSSVPVVAAFIEYSYSPITVNHDLTCNTGPRSVIQETVAPITDAEIAPKPPDYGRF